MIFLFLIVAFECYTGKNDITEEVKVKISSNSIHKRERQVYYVPVRWTSFYKNGTTDLVSEDIVKQLLSKVNEKYRNLNLPIVLNLSLYRSFANDEYAFIDFSDTNLQTGIDKKFGSSSNKTLNVYSGNTIDTNNVQLNNQDTLASYIRSWASLPSFPDYNGIFFNSNGFSKDITNIANEKDQVTELIRTFVHESFHWFGLLHTFQDGCDESSPGDYVDDTPRAESKYRESIRTVVAFPISMEWSQTTELSSCRNGIFDKLDNIMDYTSFGENITDGQRKRIIHFLKKYRQ
eukprot:NODE_169_length_14535_cov_0.769881.p6 type:complete len:291 gc:universal NODE_169_length_14535_cov_0.769881:7762-8634(+)